MAEAARPASPAGAGLEAGWLQTIFLMLASRRLNGSSTSVPGQKAKNSRRAHVFRFSSDNGHVWLHRYDRFVPCRDIAGLNCLGLNAAAASISILVVRKTPRNVINCNY
jgi:hypothetical protein